MSNNKPRIIAFYLPQFHPIPENDEWWGKGFTEWTNVAKAKKYFHGHYQPRIPADLGFYDLRVPETREAQAQLARDAGIEGFCYWHYWFDENHQLLERPFNEVLKSGKPDFPFCLAWANENWYAKLWDKDVRKDKLLIEQRYDGIAQYTKHFYDVLPAFKDERYIKQDGKPIFVIYKPLASEEICNFMKVWNELAIKEGLPGIYWIAHCYNDRKNVDKCLSNGFDVANTTCISDVLAKRSILKKGFDYIVRKLFKLPYIVTYKKASKYFFDEQIDSNPKVCPTIITGWDHSPRSGKNGFVMKDETPEQFYNHARNVIEKSEGPFVFLKSWNEWAEGNYLEPDLKWGFAYLDELSRLLRGGGYKYSIITISFTKKQQHKVVA